MWIESGYNLSASIHRNVPCRSRGSIRGSQWNFQHQQNHLQYDSSARSHHKFLGSNRSDNQLLLGLYCIFKFRASQFLLFFGWGFVVESRDNNHMWCNSTGDHFRFINTRHLPGFRSHSGRWFNRALQHQQHILCKHHKPFRIDHFSFNHFK